MDRGYFKLMARLLVSAGLLGTGPGISTALAADDSQTAVTGTEDADVIAVTTDKSANASASSSASGNTSATATGIQALAGDDTISGACVISTTANGNASLLTVVEATKVSATATGVDAGDGNDAVSGSLTFSSNATASVAYGGAINYTPPPAPIPQPDKMDTSVTAEANANGVLTGAGTDTVTTDGPFQLDATSNAGGTANQFATAPRDKMNVKTAATANATAVAINTDADADTVTNHGAVTNGATATSGALALALTTEPGKKVQIKSEASASASATATGIDTAGDGTEDSAEDTKPWPLGGDGLEVTMHKASSSTTADDVVDNAGDITNTASATAGAGAAPVSIKIDGSVDATASANASATSTGITTGGGADRVTNAGVLTLASTANAGAVSFGLEVGTPSSPAPAPAPGDPPSPATPSADKDNKSSTNTNVTADARAVAIDVSGSGLTDVLDRHAQIADGAITIDESKSSTADTDDDVVANTGDVHASSHATAGALSASITQTSGGSADSRSNSTATTYSAGILAGAGNDQVTNSGALTIGAQSDATGLTVGVAVGKPADSSGPTPPADTASPKVASNNSTTVEASAAAVGIDAEGTAASSSSQRHAALSASGLQVTWSDDATGTAGNDTVTNDGIMAVTSTANAGAGSFGATLNSAGSAASDAGANAKASATGIYTGAGNDSVTNDVALTATSNADAKSLSVAIVASKPTTSSAAAGDTKPDKTSVAVKAGATAEATTLAIDTEGTLHQQNHDNSIAIDANGLQLSMSRDDSSLAGNDSVVNHGVIVAGATADSGSLAAGLNVGAQGSVDADATSQATAATTGIHTGGGADSITNAEQLGATADAHALALTAAISATKPGQSTGGDDAVTVHSAANATADAGATGIDAEGAASGEQTTDTLVFDRTGLRAHRATSTLETGGDDTVQNSGALTASSTAFAGTAAIAVSLNSEGTTASDTNATATARANGVLTGAGNDSVANTAALGASATATSVGVSLSFVMSKESDTKATANASSASDASAVGIATGAESARHALDTQLTLNADGLAFTHSDQIVADTGADTITNRGALTASATSTAGALGAAIAIDGSASSDVTAAAKSRATGLDAGGGADQVTNEAQLTASASSTSGALALAFGQAGTEKTGSKTQVTATSTADSAVTGIAGDSGGDSLTTAALTIDSTGLVGHAGYQRTASIGDDTIDNHGGVNASATALSGAAGGAVAIDGAAKADVKSTADTRATAIDGGGGNDTVHNDGVIVAGATSTSAALALGVGAKTGASSSARASVDATSVANATSVGIAADGNARNETASGDLTINASGLDLQLAAHSTLVAGNDTLDNRNSVTATSQANSGTAAIAVSIKGAANATANTTATANAAALDAGGGADTVTNIGALGAHATANSATLNAAISTEGRATSNAGIMGAGTEATAHAVGIAGAGIEQDTTLAAHEVIDFDDIGVRLTASTTTDGIGADGADHITNSGAITTSSDALAPRVSAGITGKGVALSLGRVSSESAAAGIDGGNLDDTIDNTATISATSNSTAFLANVAVTGKGLAVAANNAWDGGTEATSTANGIDADGGTRVVKEMTAQADADLARVQYTKETTAAAGNDTITNRGDVTAIATSLAPSVNVAVAQNGVAAAVSTATAKSEANAIRGGDLADTITNAGHLVAQTTATAAAANVAITNNGVAAAADAVWDGGTTASARSRGIDGDGGDRTHTDTISVGTDGISKTSNGVLADGSDTIDNTGAVDATATSRALSVAASVSMNGVAAATATSNSTADAAAIDAGQGVAVDHVTNAGHLTANADALAASAAISFTNNGAALSADSVWDGGTKANARARGIDVGAGGEAITNSGAIDTSATATGASATVSASINGFAAAAATATGNADATAIDAAAGDDVDDVTNSGALNASATSSVYTAALSFTNNGAAAALDAVWDGGTTASSWARGIGMGNGADTVHNTGAITATGDARALALSASIAVNGVAAAATSATALSSATAIDMGDDGARDVVSNTAGLTTESTALAATASISVTSNGAALAADAPWQGGTSASASARGVRTGGGADDIDNTAHVASHADSTALAASIAVAVNGFAAAEARSTASADSIALDAGSGDDVDHVTNSGRLDSHAEANAASAAVSFTANGVAGATGGVWDGGTYANALSSAISLGGGADTVDNRGQVVTHADAVSTGVSVAVSVQGVAGAITEAHSDALASGIDAADGNDQISNSARMDVGSYSDANTISVAGTQYGLAAAGNNSWDGGATSSARAAAISAGAGTDTVGNSGDLHVSTHAVSPSVAVGFSVAGVAAAVSTATSNSDSRAIDGGDDADTLGNTGRLTVDATSDAYAVNVAVTGAGAAVAADSVWRGGTTASTLANGIAGDAGNDIIRNTGANAVIQSTANANALSLGIAISGAGLAGVTSTSTANANAAAIDAGSGDDSIVNEAAISGTANAKAISVSVAVVGAGVAVATDAFWDGGTKANATAAGISGGDGNDTLMNTGAATATSTAQTLSAAIAASLSDSGGLTLANAASTSTADSAVLSAGAGDDNFQNAAALAARATSTADGISVAFAPGGGAVTGAFDASTNAFATATGLRGDDGNDVLRNLAGSSITLDSTAQTRNLALSLALGGVAIANSNTLSDARGTGLDGGAGNDTLRNDGSITGTIAAHGSSLGVTAVAVGDATAFANSHAIASGAALAGGAGNDQLANSGNVNLAFNADATGQSISVSLAGLQVADASALSTIDGAGERGDAGADTLVNSGSLSTAAQATTTTRAISAGGVGFTVANASSIADATNIGLSGGADDDTLVNTAAGAVRVRAGSAVSSDTISISLVGAANGDARSLSTITASGLAGGDGNDTIGNDGSVTVLAAGSAYANSLSVNLIGTSNARAGIETSTVATGIDGGAGKDTVVNTGSVTVGPDGAGAWMSTLTANSQSMQFGGSTGAQSAAAATTRATGIDLGADDDTLRNAGTIDVTANAKSDTHAGSLGIFGSGSAGSRAGAFTTATGIDGGDGSDAIESLGNVTVHADALLNQDTTAYQFGGSAAANATLAAETTANGILGGSGADHIANGAALTVATTSTMTANSASSSTFGINQDINAQVTSGGLTTATGISGGDGDDVIENRSGASLDLSAKASVTTSAWGYVFLGSGPSSSATLIGDVKATGLSGDAGADTVLNRGTMNVLADASLSSNGGSKAEITGTSDTETVGSAQVSSKATGLAGGDGNDVLGSYGTLNVHAIGTAESINDGSTGAISIVNDNYAGGTAIATVSAVGFDGGAGANRTEIAGDVTVHAESTSYALAMTSGATVSFASDTHSEAKSNAYATADGVIGQAADDTVVSAATMSVIAEASTAKSFDLTLTIRRDRRSDDPNAQLAAPPEVTGDALPALGSAYPLGSVVFWTKSPQQDQDDPARKGGYWQVQLAPKQGGGTAPAWVFVPSLFITETKTIPVDSFPSYAAANGSGLDGDGKAIADGVANATARGYALGDGNNSVTTDGDVTVLAKAEAVIHTSADGDAFGSAYGYSTSTANAVATGIETGAGDDTISNKGTLTVTAMPIAQARAEASGGDICIWFFGWWCGGGGSGYGYATATINGNAIGINAGEGKNTIINDGTIIVRSTPDVHTDARTGEFVTALSEVDDGSATTHLYSSAVGILTGSGNDTVINNGTLTVEATDLSTGCSTVIPGCQGTLAVETAPVHAFGILTGAGDDVVTNNGHIDARNTYAYGLFQLLGVAIDTGAGNDTLTLGDGSTTLGTVQLGDGDDTLILRGTPQTLGFNGNLQNVDAGPGTDTLVLDGTGSYAGTPLSIERASKIHAGTYTLPSLATVNSLIVDQGTLRLTSGYQFGNTANYSTFISTDGTFGQLSTGGAANLAGMLTVEKRGDAFVANGTRWAVVQADGGVNGAFGTVQLPASMPLLSFGVQRTANTLDVVADVPSISTVTQNPLYQQIARNLDTIAGHTDTDLSQVLGRLQTMGNGFDPALASFSPESHIATAGNTFVNLHEMSRALRGHISESRTRYRIAPWTSAPEAALQFSGGSGGLGYLQSSEGSPDDQTYGAGGGNGGGGSRGGMPTQFWMLGLDASGKNDAIAGYSGSSTDTRGFLFGGDHRIGDNWMVGMQLGHLATDVDSDVPATGRIQGSFASLYGTWFNDTAHLEFGASHGSQSFLNERTLTIGSEQRIAQSKHGGNAWNAFASAGINFGSAAWSVEPFVSFDYFSVSEDAFEETGAGALDQVFAARGSESLHGAVGANLALRQQLRHSVLDWHASFAVDRDFGIDDSSITWSYAGAPQGVFTIAGRPADDNSGIYGLGVSLIGDASAFTLDWRGLTNADRKENFVSARISLRF